MTSSTHIHAHGFYGIAVGEMLEHAGHFVFLASGTHARGPCIQIAEDRVIAVLLAPSNSSRPRKAWRRTGPALLQAQFTLGQLSIGHGLQTGLHKSGANLVLADHMHNGKTASRPLNLLAQSNRHALASPACTIAFGEGFVVAQAPERMEGQKVTPIDLSE